MPLPLLPIAVGAAGLFSYLGGREAGKGAEKAAGASKAYYNALAKVLMEQYQRGAPFRGALDTELMKALGIERVQVGKTPTESKSLQLAMPGGFFCGGGRSRVMGIPTETTPKYEYQRIEGYNPEEAMAGLPSYQVHRLPLEHQYDVAGRALEENIPVGATGALTRAMQNLEVSRAQNVGAIAPTLYGQLYNQAMGLATGQPELMVQGLSAAGAGVGATIPYYLNQQQQANQQLGQSGMALGNLLYDQYLKGGTTGGTTAGPWMMQPQGGYWNPPWGQTEGWT